MVIIPCDDVAVTDEEILSGFTNLRDAMQRGLSLLVTPNAENEASVAAAVAEIAQLRQALRFEIHSAIVEIDNMLVQRLAAMEHRLTAVESCSARRRDRVRVRPPIVPGNVR